jgi:hypothetical protein
MPSRASSRIRAERTTAQHLPKGSWALDHSGLAKMQLGSSLPRARTGRVFGPARALHRPRFHSQPALRGNNRISSLQVAGKSPECGEELQVVSLVDLVRTSRATTRGTRAEGHDRDECRCPGEEDRPSCCSGCQVVDRAGRGLTPHRYRFRHFDVQSAAQRGPKAC